MTWGRHLIGVSQMSLSKPGSSGLTVGFFCGALLHAYFTCVLGVLAMFMQPDVPIKKVHKRH